MDLSGNKDLLDRRLVAFFASRKATPHDTQLALQWAADICQTDKVVISGFCGCENLRSITLPSSVEWIEDDAFRGCTSLESVTILGDLVGIGARTFEGCTKLTQFAFPKTLERIDVSAFENSGLVEVVLRSDVVKRGEQNIIFSRIAYLGRFAFAYCKHLRRVVFPE